MNKTLIKILDKSLGQRVALIGTFNLEIQGVDIKARDLDFVTDKEGINEIAKNFNSKITKSEYGYFETEFLLDGVDVHFVTQDGNNLRQDTLNNDLVYIEKNGAKIPCLSLDSELKFYQVCGRDKDKGKAELIRKAL